MDRRMREYTAGRMSKPLESAMADFASFIGSDDLERSAVIQRANGKTLAALAAAVRPLHAEINDLLNHFAAMDHSLPPDLERLESDLNSLAQAGMEAEGELAARSAD